MITTDVLRKQHDAALAMAQRLLELIDDFRPGDPAFPVLMQLNRLYGILRVHFAQEDVGLYPKMLGSPDGDVARTAQQFVDEMGDLALDMECFARHWSTSAAIVRNFAEFRDAAHHILLRLAVRVEREEEQLYPMADAEAAPQRTAA